MGTDRETTDEEQVAELLGRFVNDLGVTISAGNVLIGDKLGLYQTLAEAGPLTPSELTGYTSTAERYVCEWQPGQAAGGYLFTSCEPFFRPGYAANLVTIFDALHDMGDPVGAAVHIRQSLAPDGTLLLVEAYGGEQRLRHSRSRPRPGSATSAASPRRPSTLSTRLAPDHGRTAPRAYGGVRQ